MTITEILANAFNRIQDEYGVALDSVNFNTIDTSSMSRNRRSVTRIKIEGDAVDCAEKEEVER